MMKSIWRRRRANIGLVITIAAIALAFIHVVQPCVTNSVIIRNGTDRPWWVTIKLCRAAAWQVSVDARSTASVDVRMDCGESSVSVSARSGGSEPKKSLSGDFGYLEPFDGTNRTIVIANAKLEFRPDRPPGLVKLIFSNLYGTTRCIAG